MATELSGDGRDVLFVALTRPQMLLGVTFTYFILNAILATELFLLSKSIWVIAVALVVHAIGWLGSIRDPRFFELWLVNMQHCPRVRNFRIWGCNSYRA